MPGSYIPTRDADLVLWARNFSDLITAAPATYGLTAPIAVAIDALVDAYETALSAATDPSTRTPVTIAAKDSAKGAMVPQLRYYAQNVKANAAVSNANKEALGIRLNDPIPTPIPAPATKPVLQIVASGPLEMRLRFADELTPTSRAKPFGSIGCLVYRKIAVGVSSDPNTATFDGIFTRIPFTQTFDAADVGKTVTYWARWTNAKGEEGPWSEAIARVIQ